MQQAILQRTVERERARRRLAELTLESRSRDLYLANDELKRSLRALEDANHELKSKQDELLSLLDRHAVVTDDLAFAAELQAGLLPTPASFGPFRAAGFLEPALYVTGDSYDYFPLSDSVLAFYMSDVTGHGASSAMVSYAIHKQLNPKPDGLCMNAMHGADSLELACLRTVEALNSSFAHGRHQNSFFTMVYGLLDLSTGGYVLTQAGHPAPILCSRISKRIHQIGTGGFPVGLFADADFQVCRGHLAPGEKLLVYSDGVTDLCDSQGADFGFARLLELIDDCRQLSMEATIQRFDAALSGWRCNERIGDDYSVLVIEQAAIDSGPAPDRPGAAPAASVRVAGDTGLRRRHDDPPAAPTDLIDAGGARTLSMDIDSDTAQLRLVEQRLDALLDEEGVEPMIAGACTLAVSEALCNIVRHGYADAYFGAIVIVMRIQAGCLLVRLMDRGAPIPSDVAEALCRNDLAIPEIGCLSLDDIPESGWGMGLMTHAAQDIAYSTHEGCNTLTLSFALGVERAG